jgi:2-keto-3-deoxy-L-arabinonate dehydratase
VPSPVRGLVPILATPFTRGGALDVPSLRRLTEFQLAGGVDGLAVFGMASEGFALTADERDRILAEVSAVVAGAVPIVAGVAATSVATALEQVRSCEAGGASALMVLPPFMVKPGPAQLIDFYGEIGAAASTSVMVQDAPGPTGVSMAVPTIVELSKLEGVTSIKVEALPTAPKIAAVVEAAEADFLVLGGQNSQFLLEENARGAVGTMPACEIADLLAPIVADLAAGRAAQARQAFTPLLPLLVFGVQPGIAWAVHKEVLVRRGVIADACVRTPAAPLDPGSRQALGRILDQLIFPAWAAK